MANEPIEIRVSAEGVEAAAAKLNELGKTAKGAGDSVNKASAVGKMGLWGLGEAAENAAQSMGIPNQAARQLGNTVENLAGKFGKYAMVLGGVGLVVASGVAIWNHYQEAQRKAREETIKASDAAMKWVESARVNKKETEGLTAAKNALWQIEKERTIMDLEKGIRAQTELIIEQHKKLNDAQKNTVATDIWINRLFYGTKAERAQALKEASLDAREGIAKLKLMQESLAIAQGKGGGVARLAKKEEDPIHRNMAAREAAFQSGLLDLMRATGASKAEIWQQELETFDIMTVAKMANAKTEDEYYDILALREMERQTLVANHGKQLMQQRIETTGKMFGAAAEMFGNFSQLSDKHGRENFRRMKQASIAEATIKGYQSIVNAFEEGSETSVYVGIAYAAIAAGLVLSKIAMIKNQEYDGGGAGSAMGTYAASPATGLPVAQQPAAPAGPSITVNYYGTVIDPSSAQKAARDFLPYFTQAAADGVS